MPFRTALAVGAAATVATAAVALLPPGGLEFNASAGDVVLSLTMPAARVEVNDSAWALPEPEAHNHSAAVAAGTPPAPADSSLLPAVLATALLAAAVAALTAFAASGSRRRATVAVARTTLEYWQCLAYFWAGRGSYAECPHFADSLQARVHVRSLALIHELWSQPHYRNGNFGEDMRKNLRNVAVPGTGLPLSVLCVSALLFRVVLLVLYPLVCLAAAVARRKPDADAEAVAAGYVAHLLTPTDWFSLWRLNCRVASYHSLKTQDSGYAAEDKWTFITDALAKGIPVSPIMELPSIVCKDRNEEGGMGIHFYKNALAGGDWIIQKALQNDEFLSSMLPDSAPLSTIRIVTGSTASCAPDDPAPITPLSGVFRAGRAGALTDHDAILFDLDLGTGRIGKGSVNKEWYQLGLGAVGAPPAAGGAKQSFTAHPDCGKSVTGRTIPDIERIKQIVVDAHAKACPNVPLCGWDVALTTDGICLLEVNLSCNFFQATVDFPAYFKFVDAHLRHLEAL